MANRGRRGICKMNPSGQRGSLAPAACVTVGTTCFRVVRDVLVAERVPLPLGLARPPFSPVSFGPRPAGGRDSVHITGWFSASGALSDGFAFPLGENGAVMDAGPTDNLARPK